MSAPPPDPHAGGVSLERHLCAKIAALDQRMAERISTLDQRMGERFDVLSNALQTTGSDLRREMAKAEEIQKLHNQATLSWRESTPALSREETERVRAETAAYINSSTTKLRSDIDVLNERLLAISSRIDKSEGQQSGGTAKTGVLLTVAALGASVAAILLGVLMHVWRS